MTLRAAPDIVDWLSNEVLPYEAELRGWLIRACNVESDIDDVIQELYFRLLKLPSVDHIYALRPYLYRMALNIVIDQARRKSVISFEGLQSVEDVVVPDTSPSPERVTVARAELKWVLGLVANLPERCREVFRMRKVFGKSQAETSRALGVSESIVEKETVKGLVLISKMVADVGVMDFTPRLGEDPERKSKAKHVHD